MEPAMRGADMLYHGGTLGRKKTKVWDYNLLGILDPKDCAAGRRRCSKY